MDGVGFFVDFASVATAADLTGYECDLVVRWRLRVNFKLRQVDQLRLHNVVSRSTSLYRKKYLSGGL